MYSWVSLRTSVCPCIFVQTHSGRVCVRLFSALLPFNPLYSIHYTELMPLNVYKYNKYFSIFVYFLFFFCHRHHIWRCFVGVFVVFHVLLLFSCIHVLHSPKKTKLFSTFVNAHHESINVPSYTHICMHLY